MFFISSDFWAQEEMDTLYWYYVQSKNSKDIVGCVINHIKESSHKMKSRIAVIQQMLQQDIISLVEYDELMKFEDSQYERDLKTPSREESGVDMSETSQSEKSNKWDDIKVRTSSAV